VHTQYSRESQYASNILMLGYLEISQICIRISY
jgi:hypothetical protein